MAKFAKTTKKGQTAGDPLGIWNYIEFFPYNTVIIMWLSIPKCILANVIPTDDELCPILSEPFCENS